MQHKTFLIQIIKCKRKNIIVNDTHFLSNVGECVIANRVGRPVSRIVRPKPYYCDGQNPSWCLYRTVLMPCCFHIRFPFFYE